MKKRKDIKWSKFIRGALQGCIKGCINGAAGSVGGAGGAVIVVFLEHIGGISRQKPK
jgi:hypothetical protein